MICHVTVHTARLSESLEFYQWLLGLHVSHKIDRPGGSIVFLGEGETKFELIEDKSAVSVNATGLSIGFTVGNLGEKLRMLDSRQIPHTEVISPSPEVRFAFFTDLNGCAIQLVEWGTS